ncbi:glutathione S-transferase [Xylariaceae sp. FL0255]|nr:glutathione S-transferase [Xylariaceae sp. FL0255]
MSSSAEPSYQKDGQFHRVASSFRNFVVKDPSSQFPAEKGRYAVYASPGCPWAHRVLIVRALKGLEDVIDLYLLLNLGREGWYFDGSHGTLERDPLYGFTHLRQLYQKADPDFDGRVTVPVLWDKKTQTIVNNESSEIIRMLYAEFDDFIPEPLREVSRPGGGFYPADRQAEIDELNEWVYDKVNNGVYKSGFASTQAAYEENVVVLFDALDRLEGILAGHGRPFLLGDHLTEADIRLYTTLARFDVAYHSVFMCNLKSIRHDYPRLHLWLRRLYWDESPITNGGAFGKTTKPWIGLYASGYTQGRAKVLAGQASLIAPKGPAVLMEPLKEGEGL